jgi:hypothetical protein
MRWSRGVADTLTAVAEQMAGWPTPRAAEAGPDYAIMDRPDSGGVSLQTAAAMAGWVTTTTRDWKDSGADIRPREDGSERFDQLPRQANLAGWPTPMAGTPAQNGNNAAGNNDSSRKTVELAGWPTPKLSDDNQDRRSMQSTEAEWNREGASRSSLPLVSKMLAGWPTPAVDQFRSRSGDRINEMGTQQLCQKIEGPARLTVTGEMLTGSSAGMESGGQLSPLMSAYLMGYPMTWCEAAIAASQSIKPRRKK